MLSENFPKPLLILYIYMYMDVYCLYIGKNFCALFENLYHRPYLYLVYIHTVCVL